MRLSPGQKEWLLELLYSEYYLCEDYHPLLSDTIVHYATRKYSKEEIQLLCKNHQSLTSALYLKHTTFSDFRRFFYLWLNLLEYNICINDEKTVACILNPDPFSKAKLLRLVKHNESFYFLPLPFLYYSQHPRKNPELSSTHLQNNPSPLQSFLTWEDAQTLFSQFLTIAKNTPYPPNLSLCGEDYLQYLTEQFNHTQKYIFSWRTLYQKAPLFFTIDDTYLFSQKNQGLLLPSNLYFLNSVNTHCTSHHYPHASNTSKISFVHPPFLQKLKSFLSTTPTIAPSLKLPPFTTQSKKNIFPQSSSEKPFLSQTNNPPKYCAAPHYTHPALRKPKPPKYF